MPIHRLVLLIEETLILLLVVSELCILRYLEGSFSLCQHYEVQEHWIIRPIYMRCFMPRYSPFFVALVEEDLLQAFNRYGSFRSVLASQGDTSRLHKHYEEASTSE